MLRSDSNLAPAVEMLAEELTCLLRQDPFARRMASRAVGGEDGWRNLVTPVWLRIQSAKVDFCTMEAEQRRRFLKQQMRWAIKDLLRGGTGEGPAVPLRRATTVESADLPDSRPTSEGRWADLEDRSHLETIVRGAWRAIPPFERAILALYAGQPCEHDATVQLATRVGLGIAELVARTRRAGVLQRAQPVTEALQNRGGRRGRQGSLAEALGVSPCCIHQWTCRARNLFRAELRARCGGPHETSLPPILERLVG